MASFYSFSYTSGSDMESHDNCEGVLGMDLATKQAAKGDLAVKKGWSGCTSRGLSGYTPWNHGSTSEWSSCREGDDWQCGSCRPTWLDWTCAVCGWKNYHTVQHIAQVEWPDNTQIVQPAIFQEVQAEVARVDSDFLQSGMQQICQDMITSYMEFAVSELKKNGKFNLLHRR